MHSDSRQLIPDRWVENSFARPEFHTENLTYPGDYEPQTIVSMEDSEVRRGTPLFGLPHFFAFCLEVCYSAFLYRHFMAYFQIKLSPLSAPPLQVKLENSGLR